MNSDLQITRLSDSADQAVGILKSLANIDRLVILCHLAKSELNVSEIEQLTGIQQPTLSQQLMMLRKNDAVNTRRAGKMIYYSVKDTKILKILHILHEIHCSQGINRY